MTERRKITVTMEVTDAQGLTLEAMFRYWNKLASMGCSRKVSFYVDGDGNFKPKCVVEFPEGRPETEMTLDDIQVLAFQGNIGSDNPHDFDFDTLAWALNDPRTPASSLTNMHTYVGRYCANVRPPEKRALIDAHLNDMQRVVGKATVILQTRDLLYELESMDPLLIPNFKFMVLAKRLLSMSYLDAFHKD